MQYDGILRDEGILPEERTNESGRAGDRADSRIRMLLPTRMSTALFTLIALCFIFMGYRRRGLIEQAYIQGKVYYSAEPRIRHKTHMPSKIVDNFDGVRGALGLQNYGTVGFGNEDKADDERTDGHRTPRFHLLVAARQSKPSLCRTLLSAAALDYPSPVLVGYGSGKDDRPIVASSIFGTYDFLNGGEIQDDDLIMIIEEGNLFQLPAEVTLGRCLRHARTADAKLLSKYGRKPPKLDLHSAITPLGSPRYNQALLFGAQKYCPNVNSDLSCQSTPQSPLLIDIYGPQPDEYPGSKTELPRYLGPTMAIGRVLDLRSVYRLAKEMLEADTRGKYDGQQILARIFSKQEYVRSVRADILENKSHLPTIASVPGTDHYIKLSINYEFGMSLDYLGSIFQVLNDSTADMKFVTFKKPPIVPWPSLPSTSVFENLIKLPQDLLTGRPFKHLPAFATDVSSDLDSLPGENVAWSDIELLANIIVPTSSVPAVVSFHGNETLQDDWWHRMWFQPFGRALLKRRVKSSREGAATKMAPEGAQRWWDFRSGKGGAWVENGTWLEWNEICGGFEKEVFADGLGRFEADQ